MLGNWFQSSMTLWVKKLLLMVVLLLDSSKNKDRIPKWIKVGQIDPHLLVEMSNKI